jgi:hypothetical protein
MRLLRMWLLLAFLCAVGAPVHAQGGTPFTLFPDEDSLTLLVAEQPAPISLDGLTFRVSIDDADKTYPLESFTAFGGLPFAALPTPICFRLERSDSNRSLPLQCPRGMTFVQRLSDGDIFWWDAASVGTRIVFIDGGESALFCPAGSATCERAYTPAIAAPPPAAVPLDVRAGVRFVNVARGTDMRGADGRVTDGLDFTLEGEPVPSLALGEFSNWIVVEPGDVSVTLVRPDAEPLEEMIPVSPNAWVTIAGVGSARSDTLALETIMHIFGLVEPGEVGVTVWDTVGEFGAVEVLRDGESWLMLSQPDSLPINSGSVLPGRYTVQFNYFYEGTPRSITLPDFPFEDGYDYLFILHGTPQLPQWTVGLTIVP